MNAYLYIAHFIPYIGRYSLALNPQDNPSRLVASWRVTCAILICGKAIYILYP